MDRENLIAALVASAHAGEHLRRFRPSGASDETLPAAREWLRRWAPKPMLLAAPACACAEGRCAVCN